MPTEQEILKVIRKIIPGSKKYLFDDAAIIEKNLMVTTDTLVESTHFTLKTSTPEEIGWKAMAVNLSDVAAMGGKPLYALVSLSLPKKIVRAGLAPAHLLAWVKRFYKGLVACTKKYNTQIIGGNLARSREINISITVIGKTVVKTPRPFIGAQKGWGVSTRSNAKPGDLVFVTGIFGDSAAQNYKIKIFPQIKLGQKIVRACLKHAPALMDSSDGLADCLIQIADQSKVKIIIEEDKIPISETVKKLNKDCLNLALYGGEDYQLVGTASEIDCKKLKKLKGIKIIGKVIKGNGAFLKQNNNKLVKLDMKKNFRHFS